MPVLNHRVVGQVGKVVFVGDIPKFKVFFSTDDEEEASYATILFPDMEVEQSVGFSKEEVAFLKRHSSLNFPKLYDMAWKNGVSFIIPPLISATV